MLLALHDKGQHRVAALVAARCNLLPSKVMFGAPARPSSHKPHWILVDILIRWSIQSI